MIKFDITLFIQIVEALVMTFVLYYILIKPVMSHIRERESHFQALEKETQELIASAEEAIRKYQEELNKAREILSEEEIEKIKKEFNLNTL